MRPAALLLAIWLVGVVFGTLATPLILFLGVPAAIAVIGLLALASLPFRSLAFVSGAFTAGGGVCLALLWNADRACHEFDRRPNQTCTPPDATAFMVQAAVVMLIGLALGGIELWRRRSQRSAPGTFDEG